MTADAAPTPPTLSRDARGWWVTATCPDGVVRRIGPLRTKREATTLWLRLGGLFALGQPRP